MSGVPASPPPLPSLYPNKRRNLWRVLATIIIAPSILLTEATLVSALGDTSVFMPFTFIQRFSYGLSLAATSLAVALVWLLMEKQKTKSGRIRVSALIILLPVAKFAMEPLCSRLATGYWSIPKLQAHAGVFLSVGFAAWGVLTLDTVLPWRGLGLFIGFLLFMPLDYLHLRGEVQDHIAPLSIWPAAIIPRLTFIIPLLLMKVTSRPRA